MNHTLLDTNTVETGSSTGGLTAGSAVPAGSLVAVTVAWSNDTAAVPTLDTVTDSSGNTYNLDASAGAANTTVSCAIITSILTAALDAGDTIDLTITSSRLRWILQADAFTDVLTLDKTGANDSGFDTAMSTGTTATTTSPNELVIACFGFGRGGSADCELDVGWSGGDYVTTAAGSADRALQMGYKTVSSTGAQEGTATLSVAAAYAGCIATYTLNTADSAPPPPRPQLHNLLIR